MKPELGKGMPFSQPKKEEANNIIVFCRK